LGKTEYRSAIAQIKPNEKTTSAERDKICRELKTRGLVDCDEDIIKIKITPAGKGLLKLDQDKLPETAQLSAEKLKILKGCESETIPVSKINISPAKHRDQLIKELIDKGVIATGEMKIKEVWLSDKGKDYLAKEYTPGSGGNIQISKQMFTDYLQFIRKYISGGGTKEIITDDEILKIIKDLDREKGTRKYLPIYHLREKLQPRLSRDELDKALYRLQREDKIDLSAVVESGRYTQEQLAAGIPQNAGGCLFFIMFD
jgi:predicted transcriptional regulator